MPFTSKTFGILEGSSDLIRANHKLDVSISTLQIKKLHFRTADGLQGDIRDGQYPSPCFLFYFNAAQYSVSDNGISPRVAAESGSSCISARCVSLLATLCPGPGNFCL